MKKFLVVLTILAVSLFSGNAMALYQVKVDDDTYANLNLLLSIRAQSFEDAAPNTTDNSFDISIFNARFVFAGQITNLVKFGITFDPVVNETASTTLTGPGAPADPTGATTSMTSQSRIADVWNTLDFSKEVKVQTGVYRWALSRLTLQNSYTYLLADAPKVSITNQGTTNLLGTGLAAFRQAGITVWGDLADGMVRYNVMALDGSNLSAFAGTSSEDNIGYSARVVVNILDPEKGYTNQGTYLGKAAIANVGLGYYMQDYQDGTTDRTYTILTADAFYDANKVTAEAAYFKYDNDKGVAGSEPSGWYVQAGYLIIDKYLPALRYESWDADISGAGTDYNRIVAAVSYTLDGHNAKFTFQYLMHQWDTEGTTPRTNRDFNDMLLQFNTMF